jgi:hypothetical protein
LSSRVVVAISAYNEPSCLADLVENVRYFMKPNVVIVFDCSREQDLCERLDVDRCPTSRPLRWGHLAPFFVEVMQWLERRGVDYDYLVTLHSDMLLIRHGLDDYLDEQMVNSEYMAPGYLRTDDWCESRIPYLRRFHYGWRRIWGPLFGIDGPSWGYSPGQVFRREYADKLKKFPRSERLLELAYRSRILGIEEVFFATMADAMGCNPLRMPEEHGCHQPVVTLPRLKGYLETPSVYFIHKVRLSESDPVRVAMKDLRLGLMPSSFDEPETDSDPWPLDAPVPTKGIAEKLKDLYFHFLP